MKKNVITIVLVGIIALSIYGCGNKGKEIVEFLEAIETTLEESEETYKTPEQTEEDKGTDPIYIIQPQLTQNDTYEMQDWQAAYAEYIEDFGWKESAKYSLIYMDEDHIPELVIDDAGGESYGCLILTFHNGVTDVLQTWRRGFTYIEKGNLLNNSSGIMGHYYDRIWTIENGKWVYVTGGELFLTMGEDDREYFNYEWEGVSVEEEEYEEKLDEVFDREQAIELEQYEQLDEILFRLKTGTAMSQTHCYELYAEDVTWDEAQRRCEEKGGYLATITTIEEYEHIRKGIEDSGQTQIAYWVGAYDDGLMIGGGATYEWYEPNRDSGKYFFISDTIMGKYWSDGEPSYFKQASDEQIDELGIYLLYDDAKEDCYLYDAPMDMLLRNPEYTGKIGYICEYDPITVMSKEIYFNADGSIDYWKENEYDSAGNQTKVNFYNPSDGIIRWDEREYDNAGNRTKANGYYGDGSFYYRVEDEYDSAGNLTKETTYDADGSIHFWHEYEYDNAGNRTKSTGYEDDGSNTGWIEWEYDGSGNMTKEIQYSADGSIYGWWYKYEYDSAGNMTKEIHYNNDGSIHYWYEYEYDSTGNMMKRSHHNADGVIDNYAEWEYEYDSARNMTKEIMYRDDGSRFLVTEYEYDGRGNKTKETVYHPGDEAHRQTEWEYDNMGNLTKYMEYRQGEIDIWHEYEYITITPHNEATVSN